ncbi:NmrA family NAD(P)-binding protein [Patulibacter defluvii]|uniref:NmrA family NAD(P)-binding protein n=1 Tax=Patulibacter defluvii TaxID=3095358 RepID=UPI002A76505A|nr:NmrA family NAD(P)-binding protein [Patulibacter sp. DM4]
MSGPILVTGATGTQGGAVLRGLRAAGHQVAALVRDPDAPRARALAADGVELRRGDLTDVDGLRAAFAGAAAVYAVTTPFGDGADAEVAQGEAIVAAAEASRLPWLILASVASAGRAPVPHFESKARIEQRLRAADVPWTIVAPSYFYENVARPEGPDPVLSLALPADAPLHQLALDDLAAAAAAIASRREEHLGARVELAGDAPTPQQMAAALGARFERRPLAEVEARSHDLGAMYRFLTETGYGIDVAAVRARYPEVAWRSFASWASGGAVPR